MLQRYRSLHTPLCLCICLALSLFLSSCSFNQGGQSGGGSASKPKPKAEATVEKQATAQQPSGPVSVAHAEGGPPVSPLLCPSQQNRDQQDFVTSQGTNFAYHGVPLNLYGYTFYPSPVGGGLAWHRSNFTQYIDRIMTMGMQLGQNLIRPTDYYDQKDPNPDKGSDIVWKNMDYLVCKAQQHGTFVIIDTSAFLRYLEGKGLDPYDLNYWVPFLKNVGAHYRDQTNIIAYSIAGEPQPPTNVDAMNKLVDFYRQTTNTLREVDKHHLIYAGGFIHMESETPELPWWQKIYALPNNDVVAFKTYSVEDMNLISTIADYARQINKPLLDEEFGITQYVGDGTFSGQAYNDINMSRAQYYQAVYQAGAQAGVQAFIFWDLGCEIKPGSFEVSPNTPEVWRQIALHSPRGPITAAPNTQLCS